MNDKLEQARIALEVAACEYAETGRAKPGTAKMLQAARDFAAAEILERYQRPRPPPGSDENAMTDDEWLRAGGLAQQRGGR